MNMQTDYIFIRTPDMIKRICTEYILFIVVDGDCLTFHMQDNEQFTCMKSLATIEKVLPDHFVRIYRNCLVNANKISEVNVRMRKVILVNGKELSISFRNMKKITSAFA